MTDDRSEGRSGDEESLAPNAEPSDADLAAPAANADPSDADLAAAPASAADASNADDDTAEAPAAEPSDADLAAARAPGEPSHAGLAAASPSAAEPSDPRVAAAVDRLDELAAKDPAEHVEIYEQVHRDLQDALADAADERAAANADEPDDRGGG